VDTGPAADLPLDTGPDLGTEDAAVVNTVPTADQPRDTDTDLGNEDAADVDTGPAADLPLDTGPDLGTEDTAYMDPGPAADQPCLDTSATVSHGHRTAACLHARQYNARLRHNSETRLKIKSLLSSIDDGAIEMTYSDSSEEYRPERNKCGIPGCREDIFMGCEKKNCMSYVCYDHINSTCEEHRSLLDDTDCTESSSVSCSADILPPKNVKRDRKRRGTLYRNYNADPDNWLRSKRKRARLCGDEYVSTAKRVVRRKSVQPCTCGHGRQQIFKCAEFTDADRTALMSDFYGCGDFSRQRDYILNSVTSKLSATAKRKSRHMVYSFQHGGEKRQVCKKFFLTTLDISEKLVTYTLHRKENHSTSFSTADS
jgi:hypothetical protein